MKHRFYSLILAPLFFVAALAHSQNPAGPSVPTRSIVTFNGCPAPSVLSANLAPQFTSASATLTDSFDAAFLASAQTAINGKIGEFFASAPQKLVSVQVQQVAVTSASGLARWQWTFTVSQATEPSGTTCPTS